MTQATRGGFVAAAFLDSTLQILDAVSGEPVNEGKIRMNGMASIIISLDSRGEIVAMGTIDGRIVISDIKELLDLKSVDGWIDLV